MSATVLVVDDDAAVRESTAMVLASMGIHASAVDSGRAALDLLSSGSFDAVVLDLMLPEVDGLDVCRAIRRRWAVPILMLTARSDITDLVAGLEVGADDYITKPFDGRELVARLRALVRRANGHDDIRLLRQGELVVDPDAFRAHYGPVELDLTAMEFKLLVELMRHAGQVLTREVLLERVWAANYLGDSRLVDMAVKRVRDKLLDAAPDQRYITTVRGAGYRFERG